MPNSTKRGRRILAAGARTLGRGIVRTLTRSDVEAHWARVGGDWYETLGELKGAAMKLGQLASQYHDVLPPELSKQLARLQADAEPLPWDSISELLDDQWSLSQRKLVARIEPKPLASASIGQVHVATLRDGRKVAVKVRYPGVAAAMDADINNLGRMLRMAGILPFDGASLRALLEEVRERMAEEMDYQREREYLQIFAELPNRDGIIVPNVVNELCGLSVVVTEFVSGSNIEVAQSWPQSVRDRIGERYVDWMVEQIFDHGIVHADPHPGNYSFREDGSIVVFDFGCVKRTRVTDQRLIAAQVRAVVERDIAALHQALGEMGSLAQPSRPPSAGLARAYKESTEFLHERMIIEPPFDFADPSFITDARAIARRALPVWGQFKPVPDLAFVARALSGGYWLLRRLEAQVDLSERILELAKRRG